MSSITAVHRPGQYFMRGRIQDGPARRDCTAPYILYSPVRRYCRRRDCDCDCDRRAPRTARYRRCVTARSCGTGDLIPDTAPYSTSSHYCMNCTVLHSVQRTVQTDPASARPRLPQLVRRLRLLARSRNLSVRTTTVLYCTTKVYLV
jgi:hypothetical protein